MIYGSQTVVLRKLSKREYIAIRHLCMFCNNIRDVVIDSIEEYRRLGKPRPKMSDSYRLCKNSPWFNLLKSYYVSTTVRNVYAEYSSFFGKIKSRGFSSMAKAPHQQGHGRFHVLSVRPCNQSCGYIRVKLTNQFQKAFGIESINISVPQRLREKMIRCVNILPKNNGRYFNAQFVYEDSIVDKNLSKNRSIAIDLGVDNLATCVTSYGTTFILDGRKLKSINCRWRHKQHGLLIVAKKQRNKYTRQLFEMSKNRKNRTSDIIKKTARYIIDYCIKNDIGVVVCGSSVKPCALDAINRENADMIRMQCHGRLKEQLAGLCKKFGITYISQEESYTSKASFIDLDDMPVFAPNDKTNHQFSGRRIFRGLYRTAKGLMVNADVNGAANILRKSKQNFNYEELCSGLLASPVRIRVV